jgi:hypothetical protein
LCNIKFFAKILVSKNNFKNMPISGEEKKITEEQAEKDALVVSFTNGALQQLKDLNVFYKQPDLTELVKLGISFLQQVKEVDEKKQKLNQ